MNNNHKLIDYIDGAKDWLDKAKTEYNQANPVGGELILNLAQAEIKYAWELSRSNYVSDSKKPVRKPLRTHKLNLILPVAASIIGLLGFGWWLTAGRLQTVKNTPTFTGNPNAGLVEKQTGMGRIQTPPVVKKHLPETDKPINQLALSDKPTPVKTEPVTLETTGQPSGNKRQIEDATFSSQTRIKENLTSQSNLQPVSKLVIDEEALTEEASHSLRNGK